jgi:hypothetical protein
MIDINFKMFLEYITNNKADISELKNKKQDSKYIVDIVVEFLEEKEQNGVIMIFDLGIEILKCYKIYNDKEEFLKNKVIVLSYNNSSEEELESKLYRFDINEEFKHFLLMKFKFEIPKCFFVDFKKIII